MELRIKEAIKEQGFTIQSVAEKIGKSKQSLHGIIEKGNPTINTLHEIANAINVPIAELFQQKERDGLIGIVRHNGKPYEINSIEDVENLLKELKNNM